MSPAISSAAEASATATAASKSAWLTPSSGITDSTPALNPSEYTWVSFNVTSTDPTPFS